MQSGDWQEREDAQRSSRAFALGFIPGSQILDGANEVKNANGAADVLIGAGVVATELPVFKSFKGAAKGAGTAFKDFNQARNAAVGWLEGRGFKAERATLGKFGDSAGMPVRMKTLDGKSGFRVEFDERHGADINVWSGKVNDTFTFDGNQSMVDQLVKQFIKER